MAPSADDVYETRSAREQAAFITSGAFKPRSRPRSATEVIAALEQKHIAASIDHRRQEAAVLDEKLHESMNKNIVDLEQKLADVRSAGGASTSGMRVKVALKQQKQVHWKTETAEDNSASEKSDDKEDSNGEGDDGGFVVEDDDESVEAVEDSDEGASEVEDADEDASLVDDSPQLTADGDVDSLLEVENGNGLMEEEVRGMLLGMLEDAPEYFGTKQVAECRNKIRAWTGRLDTMATLAEIRRKRLGLCVALIERYTNLLELHTALQIEGMESDDRDMEMEEELEKEINDAMEEVKEAHRLMLECL